MAREFKVPINLNKLELNNARIQNLSSAPSSPVSGQVYYDTTLNQFGVFNGTSWIYLTGATGSGNVTKGSTATAANIIQLSGGADRSIADYTPSSAGVVKVSSAGVPSVATPGTDYAPATSGSSALRGNGSGGFASATLNDVGAATAAYSLNNQRLTNLSDPTSAQDAATKSYVDLATQGINWKQPVRAASTTNGALASSFANGQVIDSVTLATGDRILVKNQTTGSENGIYVVNASGAPTRAADADTGAKLAQAAVFVREGSTQADVAYVLSNDGTIAPGTTALVFVQFSTAGGVQAATTTTAGIVQLATQAEAQAKSNSAKALTPAAVADFARVYRQVIGDGTTTSVAVTHGLGNQYVHAQAFDASTNDLIECDIKLTSVSQTTFSFTVPPASNTIRVVIVG